MEIDIPSIQDPRVRTFYALYWFQHCILLDFYTRLAEEHYDLRLVDFPERKSDTPRESLAHIIYVQLVYFSGVKTGKLEFISMNTEHYKDFTKDQLLAEWNRIDREMFAWLTAPGFDSSCQMEVPWAGPMNAIDVLFFLRDHDILHVGWNLAVMDQVRMPRFDSLIRYWGP